MKQTFSQLKGLNIQTLELFFLCGEITTTATAVGGVLYVRWMDGLPGIRNKLMPISSPPPGTVGYISYANLVRAHIHTYV